VAESPGPAGAQADGKAAISVPGQAGARADGLAAEFSVPGQAEAPIEERPSDDHSADSLLVTLDEPTSIDQAISQARPRRSVGPWLLALGVFAGYALISMLRYLRGDSMSYDLGIFTEAVRGYAHFGPPRVEILRPGENLLGDHFHPILAVLGPVFWLFPSPITLLLAQAALVGVSVVPITRLAAAKLGTGNGYAIGAAYGFSWGLQQMVDFDFHEVAFAVRCSPSRCAPWSAATMAGPCSGRCRWCWSRRTWGSPSSPSGWPWWSSAGP